MMCALDYIAPSFKEMCLTMNSKSANETRSRSEKPVTVNNHHPHQYVAESVDYDDEAEVTATRRYPQRVRHAPSRYNDYVPLI